MISEICTTCLSPGPAKRYWKGWAIAFLVLGLFLVMAGVGVIMIVIALFAGRGWRCEHCEGEAFVPFDSPRGIQLRQQIAATPPSPEERIHLHPPSRLFGAVGREVS